MRLWEALHEVPDPQEATALHRSEHNTTHLCLFHPPQLVHQQLQRDAKKYKRVMYQDQKMNVII